MTDLSQAAAYGGPGWSPRGTSLRQEMGTVWHHAGVATEWSPLKAVLLHRPGPELADIPDPDTALMLSEVDTAVAARQHDDLAAAFRRLGAQVHYVEPPTVPPPNQMFVADLLFMTPEGAVLGRPASSVRAGEERWVARRLADLGIPILRTVRGTGTFEGADAAWIGPKTLLLALGLRTNAEGAQQVAAALQELGVTVITTELPFGTMHLMGQLRFLDRNVAVVRQGRLSVHAINVLKECGYRINFFPDEQEASFGFAHNFVTIGPSRILMPAGQPITQSFYEGIGVKCETVVIDELSKAAGGIGCLTGILERA
jgi:arginine deiminase